MILAVESAKGHIRLQFFNEVAAELMINNLCTFDHKIEKFPWCNG